MCSSSIDLKGHIQNNCKGSQTVSHPVGYSETRVIIVWSKNTTSFEVVQVNPPTHRHTRTDTPLALTHKTK